MYSCQGQAVWKDNKRIGPKKKRRQEALFRLSLFKKVETGRRVERRTSVPQTQEANPPERRLLPTTEMAG